MANGLSVKLPLNEDPDDGIALNKTYAQVARQNLINILLTIKGERVMIPDFGVGMKKFLFENDTPSLRSKIHANVISQVKKYLPYIQIRNIDFQSILENPLMDRNSLSVIITYEVTPLGTVDEIRINQNNEDIVLL